MQPACCARSRIMSALSPVVMIIGTSHASLPSLCWRSMPAHERRRWFARHRVTEPTALPWALLLFLGSGWGDGVDPKRLACGADT